MIYCLISVYLYYNFFTIGCQVVKTPMCKGVCNLFEVDRGCQKVDRVIYVCKASQSTCFHDETMTLYGCKHAVYC